MSENNFLLQICFAGEAIDQGKAPVAHLLSFLTSWRRVLQRTGRVMRGEAMSVRPGQPPQDLRSELEFDMVSLTGESEAVVLGLERRLENASFPEMDFGLKVLQTAIGGLQDVATAEDGDAMPAACDPGVLRAWRDAGVLLGQGIDSIEFTLNDREGPVQAALTHAELERIRTWLSRPKVNIRTIRGRLVMVDFTDEETRCRVDPEDGEPLFCVVDEERKGAVLANMQHNVIITGEVREDPATGQVTSIAIQDLERLEIEDSEPPTETPEPPGLLDTP